MPPSRGGDEKVQGGIKEQGKPDLEPDSPMVFSLVRKARSSHAGLLRDGPSYSQDFPAMQTAR